MPQNYLELKGITKSFNGTRVLKGVDFDARAGEVHGLIGGNGAGKSTLMNILGGLLKKDGGEICIDGRPVDIKDAHSSRKMGIAFIHQELKLFSHLSVAENICISDLPRKSPFNLVDEKAKHERAGRMLEIVGLDVDPRKKVSDISIAEQQLVEIAKALSYDTKILILDEPTSSLASGEIAKLFEVIKNLKGRGVVIIFISHKLQEIFEICDRVSVLRDGKNVGVREISSITQNELVSMIIGRSLDQYYPSAGRVESRKAVLSVEHFENAKLDDVSFTLNKGEILGLFGLIGAGRSELARAVFALDPIEKGELYLNGEKKRFKNCAQAIEAGISYLTENRREEGIIPDMGIRENVSMVILRKISKLGVISKRQDRAEAKAAFDELNIVAYGIEQKVRTLSGGNQQKVVLAKWLKTDVKALILDEPTRGVDVGAKAEIYSLMSKMAREQNFGILFISSEAEEILGVADRILVMHDGRITGEFSRGEASEQTLLSCAMGGSR